MRHLFIFLLFIASGIQAQNAGDLFKTMPSELLPGLSEGNKTMLLVDSGETIVPYALGEIKKTTHTSDHLIIKTSDIGMTEIKLLPVASDSVIICKISTVCSNGCDSHISFYTTEWDKIESTTLLPSINDDLFFESSLKIREKYKYALSLPEICPVLIRFEENKGDDLLLTLDYKAFLTPNQIEEVESILTNNTVLLRWDGVSFKK